MKTFLYKSLASLVALSAAFQAPAGVFAAAVSDERLVSLSDGSKAFIFKLSGYDAAKDGDIFLVMTDRGRRTVFRPQENPLSDAEWQGYSGVRLPVRARPTKFQVVALNPAAGIMAPVQPPSTPRGIVIHKAPTMTLNPYSGLRRIVGERAFGILTLKLEANGDARNGYDLYPTVKVQDIGSVTGKGRWAPDSPATTLNFEAANIFKERISKGLGAGLASGSVTPGDKVFVTVTLPSAWTERLKSGDFSSAAQEAIASASDVKAEFKIPLKLKLDPKRDPFDMTATVDPVGRTATLIVDSGQSWQKPYGLLPVTFSAFETTTGPDFSGFTLKTSGDFDFILKSPVSLEVTKSGSSANAKIALKPSADFAAEALKLAGIPTDLKDIVTPLLKSIRMGEVSIPSLSLDGSLPDVNVKFRIDTPKWAKDFDITVPKVDFSLPSDFGAAIAKVVFPELRANFDAIALGLALGGLKGRWTLVDLSADWGSLKLDAEGSADKGYTLAGAAALKDAGSFKMDGAWSAASAAAPAVLKVDNAAGPVFASLLGNAFPKDLLTMDDKITATLGLDQAWIDALKRGGTASGRSAPAKSYSLDFLVPFKVKLDPRREPFSMTARVDAVGKTAGVAFDSGQTWKQPFGVLPAEFSSFDLTTGGGFKGFTLKTSGSFDFVVKSPVDFEYSRSAEGAAKAAVKLRPSSDFAAETLNLAGLPGEFQDFLRPLLRSVKMGELSLSSFALDGSLPDVRLSFRIDTPRWAKDYDITVPKVDLKAPRAFAVEVGKVVIPDLRANFDAIALGLALGGLSGRWTLIDLDTDWGALRLDAEGSAAAGYTLDGRVTLDGVGSFAADGAWSAGSADAPLVMTVDNAAKPLFEASLGKALPKGWVGLGDKLTLTVGLAPEWIDALKKGAAAPAGAASPGRYDLEVSVPLTLKIDPTKEPFKLTSRLKPTANSTSLTLDAGQRWAEPLGLLPVTFQTLGVSSDLALTTWKVSAAGDMDFFKPVPLSLDATVADGKVSLLKLNASIPDGFLDAALVSVPLPAAGAVPLEELKWALGEFIKNVKPGSIDITLPGFDAKAVDLGLKFSVELPNWRHDFDVRIPGVTLKDLGKISTALGDAVIPVLIANIDKITAGLIFKGISGKWRLGSLDLGVASAVFDAEGDAQKGYALTGKVTVKEAGDLTVDGFWSPSTPLEPITFTTDNVFKTAMEKSLARLVPKDWLSFGDKITAKVGLAPSWVERLKRGGRAASQSTEWGEEKISLEVTMPLTLKFDPTKPAFKMTAKAEPLDSLLSLTFDPGQTWDKPLGLIPAKFDRLSVGADPSFTTLSIAAEGDLDFLVPCSAALKGEAKGGNPAAFSAALRPKNGNIVEALLKGRVPAAMQALVNGLLPGTVVEELSVLTNPAKSKPDVRLKFTMAKDSLSQKFDILVTETDLSTPDDFAAKAAPQVVDQLSSGAIGGAATDVLDKLGLTGDWTIVNVNLADKLVLTARAKGSPKKGYDLSAAFKPLVFDKTTLTGRWEPAKPTDPVKLTADKNVFKPLFEKTLGAQLPPGWITLKDELFVTVTLPSKAVDALKSGGAGADSGASGADGLQIELGFPVKLKIDPTKKAFDMVASVFPLQGQAQLALDAGQTWEKPYGFIPATFNTLSAASDPSFTQVTVHGEGSSDFLEGSKLEFEVDVVTVKDQSPKLNIKTKPSPDLVKAIVNKVKLPATLAAVLPDIKLERFEINPNFASLASGGGAPDAELRLSLNHELTGKIELQAKIPAGNLNDPAKFAQLAAEQIASQIQKVADLGPGLVKNAGKKLTDAAQDPAGTAEDSVKKGLKTAEELGESVEDFAKDPWGKSKDLAEGAADAAASLGQGIADAVESRLSAVLSDPVGAAEEAAKKALAAAEAVLESAAELLEDAIEFLGDLVSDGWAVLTGGETKKEKAERKRREAEEEKARAEREVWEAQRKVREAGKLAGLRTRLKQARSLGDCDSILETMRGDRDHFIANISGRDFFWFASADFAKAVADVKDGIQKALDASAGAKGLIAARIDRASTAAQLKDLAKLLAGIPVSGLPDASSLTDDDRAALKEQLDGRIAARSRETRDWYDSLLNRAVEQEALSAIASSWNGDAVPDHPEKALLNESDRKALQPAYDKKMADLAAKVLKGNLSSLQQFITTSEGFRKVRLYIEGKADLASVRPYPFGDIRVLSAAQLKELKAGLEKYGGKYFQADRIRDYMNRSDASADELYKLKDMLNGYGTAGLPAELGNRSTMFTEQSTALLSELKDVMIPFTALANARAWLGMNDPIRARWVLECGRREPACTILDVPVDKLPAATAAIIKLEAEAKLAELEELRPKVREKIKALVAESPSLKSLDAWSRYVCSTPQGEKPTADAPSKAVLTDEDTSDICWKDIYPRRDQAKAVADALAAAQTDDEVRAVGEKVKAAKLMNASIKADYEAQIAARLYASAYGRFYESIKGAWTVAEMKALLKKVESTEFTKADKDKLVATIADFQSGLARRHKDNFSTNTSLAVRDEEFKSVLSGIADSDALSEADKSELRKAVEARKATLKVVGSFEAMREVRDRIEGIKGDVPPFGHMDTTLTAFLDKGVSGGYDLGEYSMLSDDDKKALRAELKAAVDGGKERLKAAVKRVSDMIAGAANGAELAWVKKRVDDGTFTYGFSDADKKSLLDACAKRAKEFTGLQGDPDVADYMMQVKSAVQTATLDYIITSASSRKLRGDSGYDKVLTAARNRYPEVLKAESMEWVAAKRKTWADATTTDSLKYDATRIKSYAKSLYGGTRFISEADEKQLLKELDARLAELKELEAAATISQAEGTAELARQILAKKFRAWIVVETDPARLKTCSDLLLKAGKSVAAPSGAAWMNDAARDLPEAKRKALATLATERASTLEAEKKRADAEALVKKFKDWIVAESGISRLQACTDLLTSYPKSATPPDGASWMKGAALADVSAADRKALAVQASERKQELQRTVFTKFWDWIAKESNVDKLKACQDVLEKFPRYASPPTGADWMKTGAGDIEAASRTSLASQAAGEIKRIAAYMKKAESEGALKKFRDWLAAETDPARVQTASNLLSKYPSSVTPPSGADWMKDSAKILNDADRKTAAAEAAARVTKATLEKAKNTIGPIYTMVLGRGADDDGLKWYWSQWDSLGKVGVAKELLASGEFKGKGRRDKIKAMYRIILGRYADSGGEDWYYKKLDMWEIEDVAKDLAGSDEFNRRPSADRDFVQGLIDAGALK
ncbi:MAG: hypothetical protein HY928_01485 [Elusimicrobia bacterium]|nr:hypothetical protein [Elusimicrobiota bacterium]